MPHMGGASRLTRTCKGLFTHITQALNFDDTGPEEQKVIKTIISDPWWTPARCPDARRAFPWGT